VISNLKIEVRYWF